MTLRIGGINMLCQNCGKNEVNFRYTQIINGVKKEMALCEKCAKDLGLEKMDFNIPINFSEISLKMLKKVFYQTLLKVMHYNVMFVE